MGYRQEDNRGWAIIDCMMNLPLLYWAFEETKDITNRKAVCRRRRKDIQLVF